MLGFKGLSLKSDQHQLSHNIITAEFREKVKRIKNDHHRENALIFDQIFQTISLRKCMGISMKNFHVDIISMVLTLPSP